VIVAGESAYASSFLFLFSSRPFFFGKLTPSPTHPNITTIAMPSCSDSPVTSPKTKAT